jgi:hypothetical protein
MQRLAIVLAAMSLSLCLAQEVHVSPIKNGVLITVPAQKTYHLVLGQEEKTAHLGVECLHKGKVNTHLPLFMPGGSILEDSSEFGGGGEQDLAMTLDGHKQVTPWVGYDKSTVVFTYAAHTEADRMQMIQSMLRSSPVSVEFKPFLTGQPTTVVFDLEPVRTEMAKHPECAPSGTSTVR